MSTWQLCTTKDKLSIAPKPCRTHAQVLADEEQHERELEAQLAEVKANQLKLAEMELDEEDAQAEAECGSTEYQKDPSDKDKPFFNADDKMDVDEADETIVSKAEKVSNLIEVEMKAHSHYHTALSAQAST